MLVSHHAEIGGSEKQTQLLACYHTHLSFLIAGLANLKQFGGLILEPEAMASIDSPMSFHNCIRSHCYNKSFKVALLHLETNIHSLGN